MEEALRSSFTEAFDKDSGGRAIEEEGWPHILQGMAIDPRIKLNKVEAPSLITVEEQDWKIESREVILA